MKVMLKGIIYDSVSDAAKAYNVTEHTIRRALNEGREDKLQPKKAGCKQGRPEPFTIEGITFPNQKAANDAFGLPFNTVTQAVNRGSATSMARIIAAARAYKEKMGISQVPCTTPCKKCLPVSHNGLVYQCAKTLSDHIGVSKQAIYQALCRTGSTEICGKARGGRNGNSNPITIGRHSWPSVSAMAREIGVERSTACKQLKRDPIKVMAAVWRWERETERETEIVEC